jgi:hypothetical protein
MTAANQHIEIDGRLLKKQAALLQEAATVLEASVVKVRTDLPGDAFGALNRGLVSPLATALATEARGLLSKAAALAERSAEGVQKAAELFATVEEQAVENFARADL